MSVNKTFESRQRAARSMMRHEAIKHEERALDVLVRRLNGFWAELGNDIAPHVEDNEQAVEVLIDRAYDRLSTEQQILCAKRLWTLHRRLRLI